MPCREASGRRQRECAAALAMFAAILPVAAAAQAVTSDSDRCDRAPDPKLQAELKQLKSQLGEAKQQLRQSRAEAQRAQDQLRQAAAARKRAAERTSAAAAKSRAAQAAAQAQSAAAALPAAAGPSGVNMAMPGGRPTITSSDGRASFAIGAQVAIRHGRIFPEPEPDHPIPKSQQRREFASWPDLLCRKV